MICFTSSLIRICIILQQISTVCCCNCWALTLRTVCLNTERAIGIWYSWLKHLNCWWKAVKNYICYSCIFNVQLHVHFKKWTFKFKLRYLRNYISYFNKICSTCCANTRIQRLKFWLKSVQSWLKYSIFSRGLFLLAHPVDTKSMKYKSSNRNTTTKNELRIWDRFTCLLWHPAWKWSGAILQGKDKGEVNKKRTYQQEKKEASYKKKEECDKVNEHTNNLYSWNLDTVYD